MMIEISKQTPTKTMQNRTISAKDLERLVTRIDSEAGYQVFYCGYGDDKQMRYILVRESRVVLKEATVDEVLFLVSSSVICWQTDGSLTPNAVYVFTYYSREATGKKEIVTTSAAFMLEPLNPLCTGEQCYQSYLRYGYAGDFTTLSTVSCLIPGAAADFA